MALVKTLTAKNGTAWSNLRKNLGRHEMKLDSSWWCPSCTRYAMPTWKPAVQLSAEASLPWSEDHRPVAALPIGVADRYRYSLWWAKFGLATLCWSNVLFHSCRLLQHSYSGSTPWFSSTCCFDCFFIIISLQRCRTDCTKMFDSCSHKSNPHCWLYF